MSSVGGALGRRHPLCSCSGRWSFGHFITSRAGILAMIEADLNGCTMCDRLGNRVRLLVQSKQLGKVSAPPAVDKIGPSRILPLLHGPILFVGVRRVYLFSEAGDGKLRSPSLHPHLPAGDGCRSPLTKRRRED